MIGEVLDGTADFAIADISITSKRASAVKFTMPWMNLGISILYTRPRPAPPSMLAFLDPFTTDVSSKLIQKQKKLLKFVKGKNLIVDIHLSILLEFNYCFCYCLALHDEFLAIYLYLTKI